MNYLDDIDFKNKRVLVRAGFDVPLDESGKILDDTRIRKCLPTFKKIINDGGILIILSHNGRPKHNELCFRMNKTRFKLQELLGQEVIKLDDCIGNDVKDAIKHAKQGNIILLENVRFHKEEKSKDENIRDKFGEQLAKLADYYVNEAFTVSHRDHASITSIPKFIPGFVGYQLQKELELCDPSRLKKPIVAIIGGAKADKIDVISNLINKVDKIIIGGVLANTFLKAKGINIKASKYDPETLDSAKSLLQDQRIVLPLDVVSGSSFSNDADAVMTDLITIPDDYIIMDIGSQTIEIYCQILSNASSIIWGGPIGVFEFDKFANGTRKLAEYISNLDAASIIGGGDSAAAIERLGFAQNMTHISTGGGAFLAMMAGKELPGIRALKNSRRI